VLVVEDDEEVLSAALEGLQDLGYRVVPATNAAQALDILRGDTPVEILFSDIVMPGGMNGVQLAVEARRLRPSIKVLLTSGYADTVLRQADGLPGDLQVLGKPYRRAELASKLRLVVGE
jgi:CheY-like chemotaxis protein